MTTHAEIGRLENNLAVTIASIPDNLAALTAAKADAGVLLAQHVACPTAETLAKLESARGKISTAEAVLAEIGNPASWPDKVKSAWVTTHYAELLALLERALHERTSRRTPYRHAAAKQLGELTTRLVTLDGDGANDTALESANAELAAIEDDLADREARLNAANEKLKIFKLANGIDSGPNSYHGELFKIWQYARDAVFAVDFEPAPLEGLEKIAASKGAIQQAVVTPSRRTLHTAAHEAGGAVDGRHD